MSPEVMKLLFFGGKIRLIWVACPRPEPVLPWLQGIAAETTIFDTENLTWLQALKPDAQKYEKLEFRDVPKSAEIREYCRDNVTRLFINGPAKFKDLLLLTNRDMYLQIRECSKKDTMAFMRQLVDEWRQGLREIWRIHVWTDDSDRLFDRERLKRGDGDGDTLVMHDGASLVSLYDGRVAGVDR
ncbi:unnamed protein product, partial [Mesorhabditis spiculigera]